MTACDSLSSSSGCGIEAPGVSAGLVPVPAGLLMQPRPGQRELRPHVGDHPGRRSGRRLALLARFEGVLVNERALFGNGMSDQPGRLRGRR